VRAFAGNSDVSFGDVNLSEEGIRGAPHNPGAGGWPTIRYFNKETGVDGGTYKKVTDKAMCEELGNDELMTAYVEEYGGTSQCSVDGETGCNDKEKAYIAKMKVKSVEELKAQQLRLLNMGTDKMKPELKSWINKRSKILKQLLSTPKTEL